MTRIRMRLLAMIGVLLLATSANVAWAGSHLWVINEIFTNADGTIQFIEMKECCGAAGETAIGGKWVDTANTSSQYIFPTNLVGPTSNKYLLLATDGFAALPGAPTPDFIIEDNFLQTGADTVHWWLYTAADLTYGDGELPTDGINSLNKDGTTGVNSPTNYSDETGSVDASNVGGIPAISEWGVAAMCLSLLAVGSVAFNRRKLPLAA